MDGGFRVARDPEGIASGANDESGEIHRSLGVGEEDGRLRRILEFCLASVGDDTDDFSGLLEGPTDAELLSKNILAREIAFDEGVIDDGDGRSVEIVARREVAASEESGAHGLKVARTDNEKLRRGRLGGCRRGLIGRREAGARDLVHEGKEMSRAGSLHSGSAADFGENAVEILGALEIVGVAGGRRPDMHGEEMISTETGVGRSEAGEAAEHESGANGKKQREGDFDDNEDAAEGLMAANATAEGTLFESVLEVDERKAQGGNKTKEHRGEERGEEREEKHAHIDGNGLGARKLSLIHI